MSREHLLSRMNTRLLVSGVFGAASVLYWLIYAVSIDGTQVFGTAIVWTATASVVSFLFARRFDPRSRKSGSSIQAALSGFVITLLTYLIGSVTIGVFRVVSLLDVPPGNPYTASGTAGTLYLLVLELVSWTIIKAPHVLIAVVLGGLAGSLCRYLLVTSIEEPF